MNKYFFRSLLAVCWLLSLPAWASKPVLKSKKDEVVTITTSLGDIRLILFGDTPLHRANFLRKAKAGFYNGTTFHRVIPQFMVQGGDPNSKDSDPNNDGQGPANEPTIPAELAAGHKHDYGAVAAARQGDFVNPQRASSSSQFYLVENHQGTHFLDGQYTVFGQVIQGQEVIDKIAALPKDGRDRPLTDLKMTMKVERLRKKKITQLYGYAY
ncbi:peptidylprolyl isomerase [Hymenobacter sp. BT559]|jgi:peptidyl-prolyl cis-trans isomerase B (cyclophilin B)|uniref:peptidylprolyl isomerase n=1 Tax=Hymenobacter sp. BT559 TaxID=2795729 RepID=UPI0018ECC690|nr:peptidylprolyl isomerase [Hymenobacter sp. BT559]MBJ6143350.1 peptidylprolyl isomerase [Hymenobacter sp. BT559]